MPSDSVSRIDASASTSTNDGSDNLSTSPGASSLRHRTDSESSDKQARFILPGTAGSPPKVLTMDEVMDCVKNLDDMTLAHEIAINPEFKLRPFELPENSLERRVKDMIHQAFWDLLRSQLNSTPPCYDQAIQLLEDVKEYFDHIFLANNRKIMDHIREVLDGALIRQQAERGCIDFRGYATFVIDIMAKSCAPIRDEQVAALRDIEDVVDTFRDIMECLTIMRLDVANCLLDATRGEVIANSVEYEKKKFKKHLETYTLGFPITEAWLRRNKTAMDAAPPQTPSPANGHSSSSSTSTNNGVAPQAKFTISNAYLELIDWDGEKGEFPELLEMDETRIRALRARALRLCTCVSTMAIASGVPVFAQNPNMKKSFASELEIITQSIGTDRELEENIENIWLQLRSAINKYKADQQLVEAAAATAVASGMDDQAEQMLRNQVIMLAQAQSPVRSLMWKRLKVYLRLCLYSKQIPPAPPGFQDFVGELENLSTCFRGITSYNYAVFGEYYQELIDGMQS